MIFGHNSNGNVLNSYYTIFDHKNVYQWLIMLFQLYLLSSVETTHVNDLSDNLDT